MDLPDFDIVLNHGDLPLLRTTSQGLLTVESPDFPQLKGDYAGLADVDSSMALRGKSMRNPLSMGPWTKRCSARLLQGVKTCGTGGFRGFDACFVRPGPLLLSSASVRQKISGISFSPMLGPQLTLPSVCTDSRLASSAARVRYVDQRWLTCPDISARFGFTVV